MFFASHRLCQPKFQVCRPLAKLTLVVHPVTDVAVVGLTSFIMKLSHEAEFVLASVSLLLLHAEESQEKIRFAGQLTA